MTANLTDFRWVFHVGFLLDFSYGFSVGLDSIFVDFGFSLGWVLLWVWVDYELGFPMGLAWFLFGLVCIEMGCGSDVWVVLSWWLDVCHLLLLCWVVVAIGKERVVVAVGKERENLKGEREKKNKLLIYTTTVTVNGM